MAQHLLEVLQDKLDLSSVNMHECIRLSSPEMPKAKILMKGKAEDGTDISNEANPSTNKRLTRSLMGSLNARPQECEPFVRPSVFHRLTRVPYGAVLEEARALNTDCVQDVFHWSCHTFEMDGRSHCPGAGPSMDAGERGRPGAGPSTDTVVANCTAVIGSQDPHITPREVCAVLSQCQSQDEYVWPHAYLLPQLTQGLQPSPQSEVHVLSRQELMEMHCADTCLSRVLFFVEWQRRPSRREHTHEAVDELRLLRHWERLSVKMGGLYRVSKNIISRKKSFQRCVFSKSPEARAPLESIVTTRPLELVCIDFWSAEDSSNKSVDVLVVTDHFTKLAQAYPCSNQSAKVVARQLWNNFFCTYGFPERVYSDQGANFESSLIAEMLQVAGIQKSHTTPYHPMGNGCVERFNRTLGNMIRALPPKAKHRWPQMLKALTFSYNSTVHETTGYAPFNLMFGRCPSLPVDMMFELVLQDEQVSCATDITEDVEDPSEVIAEVDSVAATGRDSNDRTVMWVSELPDPGDDQSDASEDVHSMDGMMTDQDISPLVGVGEYVYDRQLLLDIRNKDFCYEKHWLSVVSELGLLRRGGPWKSAAPLGEPPTCTLIPS
ncbi:hypothetical protein AAFF_G00148180 [Aldrovandia affinis]|uniref:Integrase catalytic domain-containing protein n=1 Tax=Aldrovandia affinis TaxID=143900 RepID=A0AAD7RPZ8_9TELE|nr:hypothetical protein AAFF_G00148180 [Aldrovandia affinis]